MELKLKPNGE